MTLLGRLLLTLAVLLLITACWNPGGFGWSLAATSGIVFLTAGGILGTRGPA